jgi:DNA-binding NarL/FixJ family response regulator
LIVDSHPIFREGLAQVINRERDLFVCGEAATASEGLAAAVQHAPSVAIMDISLAGGSGLDLIKRKLGLADATELVACAARFVANETSGR